MLRVVRCLLIAACAWCSMIVVRCALLAVRCALVVGWCVVGGVLLLGVCCSSVVVSC